MALKGTILKKEITDKILATFPGSFLYNDGKEIRIPGTEEGQELQVKVALTCAKTNVLPNGDTVLPGEELNFGDASTASTEPAQQVEVSQEEKENVKRLMEVLGL